MDSVGVKVRLEAFRELRLTARSTYNIRSVQ